MARPFLTARWENLLLLNFACPRELLDPLVPRGTELDPWKGTPLVSLVAFRFLDTRLRGVIVPGHRHFDEVNLRFYVRAPGPGGETRRGVVFVREFVPRWAIATVARVVYNEPYRTAVMSHEVALDPESGGAVRYAWTADGETHTLQARVSGPAAELVPGSEGEFITEHYWGYTAQRDGGTLEYQVEHPPWRIWKADEAAYAAPAGATLYGPAFAEVLSAVPRSAFVAVGSPVRVYPGASIDQSGQTAYRPS